MRNKPSAQEMANNPELEASGSFSKPPQAQTRRLLNELLLELPLGVVIIDHEEKVVAWNHSAPRLCGFLSHEDPIGQNYFNRAEPKSVFAPLRPALGSPKQSYLTLEFPVESENSTRWVCVTWTSFDLNGEFFVAMHFEDVTAERKLSQLQDWVRLFLAQDLKSSLWSMMINLNHVLEGLPPEGEHFEAALDSQVEGKRMQRMLSNLLDVYRNQEKPWELNLQPVSILRLVEKVVLDAQDEAAFRKIQLHIKPSVSIEAMVDEDMLKRAIENMIEHAFRFADSNIWVSVEGPEPPCICVEDDGINHSVKPLHEHSPWAPPNLHQSRIDDRGLCFTFCDLVARAHGGEILHEEGENGRSSLVFFLKT
jgi:signal transduction histidine kinase